MKKEYDEKLKASVQEIEQYKAQLEQTMKETDSKHI